PFVVEGTNKTALVSACIWSSHLDIELLSAWASRWEGTPTTLVLMNKHPSSTLENAALSRNISKITSSNEPWRSSLSIHLLNIATNTQDHPNAYINLARLFARSSHVLLFPDDLSTLPPVSAVSLAAANSTIFLTSKPAHPGFPFLPLTPIMLHRGDNIWCTERFLSGSRILDWEECLWQVWLQTL
ncbi:hypothetical protein JAAARDRAFT_111746, partial [Jaapia argillacea MUCL 33604]